MYACAHLVNKLVDIFLTCNGTVLHWIIQSSSTGSVNKSAVKHEMIIQLAPSRASRRYKARIVKLTMATRSMAFYVQAFVRESVVPQCTVSI